MDHRPGTSSGGGGGGVGTGSGGGASDSTGTITGLGGGVGGATTGRHGRERSGSNADNTDAASVRSVGTSLTGTTSIIGGGTGTGVGVGTGGAGVAPSEGGRSSRSVMGVGSVGSGSGPTMRSRVTVVCAECKKQKLKCDRRMPCESCQKRNTVERCIYTAAAIEKVDVTALNNRLRVVEGALNDIVGLQGLQQLLTAAGSGAASGSGASPSSSSTGAGPSKGGTGSGLGIGAGGNLGELVKQLAMITKSSGGNGNGVSGSGVGVGAVGTQQTPSASPDDSDPYDPYFLNPESGTGLGTGTGPGSSRRPRLLAHSNVDGRSASGAPPLDGVPALWLREIVAETGHNLALAGLYEGRNIHSGRSLTPGLGTGSRPVVTEGVGGVPAGSSSTGSRSGSGSALGSGIGRGSVTGKGNGSLVTSSGLSLCLKPIDKAEASTAPGAIPDYAFGSFASGSESGSRHRNGGTGRRMDAKQALAMHAGLGLGTTIANTGPDSGSSDQTGAGKVFDLLAPSSSSSPLLGNENDLFAPIVFQLISQLPRARARRWMMARLGAAYEMEGSSAMPFTAFCMKVERVCEAAQEWAKLSSSSNMGHTSASGISMTMASMNVAGGKGKEREIQVPPLSDVAEAAAALALGALIWTNETPSTPSTFSPPFAPVGSPSASSGTSTRDAISGRLGTRPIVPITITPILSTGGFGGVGGVGPPTGFPFGVGSPDENSGAVGASDLDPERTNQTTDSSSFVQPEPDPNQPYALYRLARLAIDMHVSRHGHAARDLAMIHAYVILAHYLLCAHPTSPPPPPPSSFGIPYPSFSSTSPTSFPGGGGSGAEAAAIPPELPPLVGALVWEARAMGLDVDPDEFDPIETQSHPGRLGGRGTSGVIGVGVGGSLSGSGGGSTGSVKREEREDGTSANEIVNGLENSEDWIAKHSMSLFVKEMRRRLWWSVVWLDLIVADSLGYKTTIAAGEYSTRLPTNVDDTGFLPSTTSLPPPDEETIGKNITFYLCKVRLLAIIKSVPLRVFRPGSNLNTASGESEGTNAITQMLADEITKWLENVPEKYKFSPDSEELSPQAPPSPPPMTPLLPSPQEPTLQVIEKSRLIAQKCDLMFSAYHSIMRLFTPKVLASPEGASTTTSKMGMTSTHFATLRAVEPALQVVQAAEILMTHAPHAPRATFHMYAFPQRLFEAATVLLYVAIQQPLYTSPEIISSAHSSLRILKRILPRPMNGEPTETEWTLEVLLKRAENAKKKNIPGVITGGKRKLADMEQGSQTYGRFFKFPFVGIGVSNEDVSYLGRSSSVNIDIGTGAVSIGGASTVSGPAASSSFTVYKPGTAVSSTVSGPSSRHGSDGHGSRARSSKSPSVVKPRSGNSSILVRSRIRNNSVASGTGGGSSSGAGGASKDSVVNNVEANMGKNPSSSHGIEGGGPGTQGPAPPSFRAPPILEAHNNQQQQPHAHHQFPPSHLGSGSAHNPRFVGGGSNSAIPMSPMSPLYTSPGDVPMRGYPEPGFPGANFASTPDNCTPPQGSGGGTPYEYPVPNLGNPHPPFQEHATGMSGMRTHQQQLQDDFDMVSGPPPMASLSMSTSMTDTRLQSPTGHGLPYGSHGMMPQQIQQTYNVPIQAHPQHQPPHQHPNQGRHSQPSQWLAPPPGSGDPFPLTQWDMQSQTYTWGSHPQDTV